MNTLLQKMLFTKILLFGDGTISLFGRTVVFIPIDVIIELQGRIAKELGEEAANRIIYKAGEYQTETGSKRYLAARKALSRMFQKLPITGDPSLEMGRQILKFAGWGDIKILTNKESGKKMVLEVKNSPFVQEYLKSRGKSRRPVCHYLAGLIAGVADTTYGKRYAAFEKSCAATGLTDRCLFEIKAKR